MLIQSGTYPATLTSVFRLTNAYGERIAFEFTLHGQYIEGRKVLRSTSPNPSPQGKLADTVRGILGRDLDTQEHLHRLDLKTLIGSKCLVLVIQSTNKAGKTHNEVAATVPEPKGRQSQKDHTHDRLHA